MQVPGFLGPTYPGRSTNFQSDRTINFFPELSPDPNAKSVLALVGTPGTLLHATAGGGPIRGMCEMGEIKYVVSGSGLYSITEAGTVSALLGSLATSSGPVTMKHNGMASAGIGGNQLAICDKSRLYVFNVSTSVFSTVTLSFTPGDLDYLDGYFITIGAGTMSFHVSDLYDGLTWNALATASVLASPDPLIACCAPHQELWFIKKGNVEVWYDAGVPTSQGSPFVRLPGAVIDYGTPSPDTVVVGANSVFMLASAKVGNTHRCVGVVTFNGYSPTIISPPAINYKINHMTSLDDAFAFMFGIEGHVMYVLTFPTDNVTLVYDVTTAMWHEWSTYIGSPYAVGRHLSNACVGVGNVTYVGDWRNGNVYKVDTDYGSDNGDPIVSVRIASHLFDRASLDNVFLYRMQLDMETGTGDGHGSNPAVELSFSDDGGHTFGTPFPASIGRQGDFKREVTWRRLGFTRNGVTRILISDVGKRVLLGAYAEVGK